MDGEQPSHGPIRFGLFEVDFRAGELRKQGVKIKLQEQPLQILAMLLEHPGDVVTREKLRNKLWPADTFVDFDHGLNKSINKLREALGDSAENPRFIETLPKRGYRFMRDLQASPGQIRSLLVLPLENLSRDPEQEYFADGLTEELITKLAKIGALRVLSRTTAMHYKGVRKPLPEIARELQVEGVVEGTVLRSGERVRISAQLIHAPTDTHLWADSYERDLRNVLALQSEVAQAIAQGVQVKLTPQEQANFAQVHPVDPEAYEAYLKGRYHWNRRTIEGLNKGGEYFQQAIEKDPGYAAAYAGLADSLSLLCFWGFVSPNEGSARAKVAAQKALEIDNTLAEAHASLALGILHWDADTLAAQREFRRAIELNSRYTTIAHWYAACLSAMGRMDDALAEIKRVLQLDPLSPSVKVTAAMMFYMARRPDGAIEQCRDILELNPSYLAAHWLLGLAYVQKAMFEEAIHEFRQAVDLSVGAAVFLGALGYGYGSAGRRKDALKVVEQLQELLPKQRYVMPYWMAMIYASLDEKEEAFRCLDIAYQERSAWIVYMKVLPWFDNLRPDARFQDLLRRMNLPP